ncbi:MAG: glycosyltransferase family 4 protein [Rickettsiaceae bacterium]
MFSNDAKHFYDHLLPIAIAGINQGYDISLVTSNIKKYKNSITQHGINVICVNLNRNSINPIFELIFLIKIIKIIKDEAPDFIHNFTIKPILYGSIASIFCKKNTIVINNFLGLGYIFTKSSLLNKTLRFAISKTLFFISKFRKKKTIVQNKDDKLTLINHGLSQEKDIYVCCSVGIDTSQYHPLPEPKESPIILALVGRMLIKKGVYEFIDAARMLKNKNLDAEFWLVGTPDMHNKSSIPLDNLNAIAEMGIIKYLGYQDVRNVWGKAHIAVLPSYREGLSRSLLEAGGYGRAIITTDAPGGRDLIQDSINGLLVKPKNANDLARAMEVLIKDKALRLKLGNQIHKDVMSQYDSNSIAKRILQFYED